MPRAWAIRRSSPSTTAAIRRAWPAAALREIKVADELLRPGDLLNFISRWKTQSVRPEQAASLAHTDKEHLAAMAYRRYQKALKQAGAVDFDDLLLCTEELFEQFADVRKAEAGRFSHLLIDEYQDTNGSQYRIVKALAGGHRNLCVVGDDDQSIYGWRGAEVSHILRLQARLARGQSRAAGRELSLDRRDPDAGQSADRVQQAAARQGAAAGARRRREAADPAMPGRRRPKPRRSSTTFARGWPTARSSRATSRSCFAPTSSRAPSRSNCARPSCPTCWSAACRFTIARKSATSWPI